MNELKQKNIQPQAITKPIQLLAAWLFALIAITGTFLSAAVLIDGPTWIKASLVGAAIVFVPLFLVAMVVLQTKFRPQMQEDNFYAEWLKDKASEEGAGQLKEYLREVQGELVDSINSLKQHGTLHFSSEDEFYDKVNYFVRRAEKKIEAIDYIPPSMWRKDFVLRRYIEIQSLEVENLKKRIHIYNEEAIGEFKEDYNFYVTQMHAAGFSLGFLSRTTASQLGVPVTGGVNIDDNCLIANKDPLIGAEVGVVSFLQEDIDGFCRRFELLSSKAMEAEVFMEHLAKA